MSQLIKHIHADENRTYFFKVFLDHAPETGEKEAIEYQIQNAMKTLGVPAEQVGVTVLKSVVPATTEGPQEKEDYILTDGHYLLAILIQTEEGGFTEEPNEVAESTIRGFLPYAQLTRESVAAVVLENVHLEVESRIFAPPSITGVEYERYGPGSYLPQKRRSRMARP